jgi:23S rRNA pseudouridine2605 synthase
LRITLHEGRNRQVRRMCEAVGHPVRRLVRTRIGPLRDPSLEPGEHRSLTLEELADLEAAAHGAEEADAGRGAPGRRARAGNSGAGGRRPQG